MTRDIVVNGRFLSRRVTGVERHGHEILRHMGGNFRVEKTRANGLAGHIWEQFFLPLKSNSKSILWSPANTGPLMVRDQALTIHDLSPLEHPEWFRASFTMWYRLLLPVLVKRVQKVFTPSDYVKQKICTRFGIENVLVTPNGVSCTTFHPHAEQHTQTLPENYVLFVGSIEPRKNLNVLLQAWNEIKDDFKKTWLVIVGTSGHVFQPIKLLREAERVRFLGYVEEKDLPGLYAGATVFVLPSLDEGFGLPAIEAMACGAPVLVSNGGALPETIGDAGLIFDLSKPNDLATSLKKYLSCNDLRQSYKEKSLARAQIFSWQSTAELIWNTLNEI